MRDTATNLPGRFWLIVLGLLIAATLGTLLAMWHRPSSLAGVTAPSLPSPSMPETKDKVWQFSLAGKSGGGGTESSATAPLVNVTASSSALVESGHVLVTLDFGGQAFDKAGKVDSLSRAVTLDIWARPEGGISFGEIQGSLNARGKAMGIQITRPSIVGQAVNAGSPITIHIGFTATGDYQGNSASVDSFIEIIASPVSAAPVKPTAN